MPRGSDQYVYAGFSRRKIPRSMTYTIAEKAIRFRHPDYNPDRAQKLISSSMSRHLSTRNISAKSMHAFLRNLANRQTDRQTLAYAFTSSFVGGNKNLAIANRSRVSCPYITYRPKYITPWLESLKVTVNGTIGQIIHDLLLLELFDVKYYRDLEMWVRGHSRSLKVVTFESLSTVSYSPSIVTMAVSLAISEIFSVKEWPDLEILVWGPSRSSKWCSSIDHVLLSISPTFNYSSILYHLRGIWSTYVQSTKEFVKAIIFIHYRNLKWQKNNKLEVAVVASALDDM